MERVRRQFYSQWIMYSGGDLSPSMICSWLLCLQGSCLTWAFRGTGTRGVTRP